MLQKKHPSEKKYATLNVKIANPAAVSASTKGKTYSVSVVVKLKGCDSINRDAKATIKIIVKK